MGSRDAMTRPVKRAWDSVSKKYIDLESEEDVKAAAEREVHQATVLVHGKYDEEQILADLTEYLRSTYSEHYQSEDIDIECFDAWIAMGDSVPTFRNTAIKYLWRYGKKNGHNKADLLKAIHYIILMLHVDHYKKEK